MESILDGLTGGLDLDVVDTGYGLRDGHTVSYAPKARRFGAVLPANSPGVHALWLPAIALKMPLALKPGQPSLDAAADHGIAPCGRFSRGGLRILSLRARRRRRDPAQVRSVDDVRLRCFSQGLAGRPADRNPRTGLQQGAPRTGQGRRLARLPRFDRHLGFVQRRTVVHQCVERADAGLRPQSGCRLGGTAFGNSAALARRLGGASGRVRRSGDRSRHRRSHQRGLAQGGARTFRPASAARRGWSSSRAAATFCPQ